MVPKPIFCTIWRPFGLLQGCGKIEDEGGNDASRSETGDFWEFCWVAQFEFEGWLRDFREKDVQFFKEPEILHDLCGNPWNLYELASGIKEMLHNYQFQQVLQKHQNNRKRDLCESDAFGKRDW